MDLSLLKVMLASTSSIRHTAPPKQQWCHQSFNIASVSSTPGMKMLAGLLKAWIAGLFRIHRLIIGNFLLGMN
jgi:hypothetical protein